MTQHALQEQTDDDSRIMRRLFIVVGGFMVATAVMALSITAVFY
jgi:hypothetical protein